MKTALIYLTLSLLGIASARERHVSFDGPGSRHTWLPVTLTAEEQALFAKRSDPPKTALDYYLMLPGIYFRNISDGLERRITFIDRITLSDQYLHADYTIPSTDAGSFSITIRLFGDEENPLIAISHLSGDRWLYLAKENGPQGLWAISLNRPEFWRYRGGAFTEDGALVRVPDSVMPELPVERILDRYRNHYKAHLNHPTQKKSISLAYELPQRGNSVRITGRENFMDPSKEYIWAEFIYNADRFDPSTKSEQDGTSNGG